MNLQDSFNSKNAVPTFHEKQRQRPHWREIEKRAKTWQQKARENMYGPVYTIKDNWNPAIPKTKDCRYWAP
jgi:hypothetical protein